MSAKLVDRKDVLAHIDRMSAWWNDISLDDVLFDGMTLDAAVAGAITNHEFKRTMAGPGTFSMDLHDPDRVLQNEVLPGNDEAIIAIGDQTYALAQVSKSPGASVGLTFENEESAWLKRYTRYRKVRRGTHTRAEFIFSMLREVAEGTLYAYVPDLHEKQSVIRAKSSPGKRGLTASDKLKIKGEAADSGQLRALNDALETCEGLRAPTRAKVAVVACAIQENEARNKAGGDQDSTAFLQQRKSQGWQGDLSKVSVQVTNFLRRAPAGIKPFLTVMREHPNESIGWQIDEVQRSATFGTSRQGKDHGQWVAEAKKIVAAYGSGGSRSTNARYEFARGEPGKRESTWATALRLAEEVAWRFFLDGNMVFYLDDEDLMAAAPGIVLSEDVPGIQISYDYDFGKKVNTATVESVSPLPGIMPGMAIELENCGYGDGIYVIESQTRKNGESGESIDLIRPAPARREPAGETTTKRGRGGANETKSSGWVTPLKSMPSPSGKFGEQRPGHLHAGIDFPAGVGTPVRSVADGTITHAGAEGGYGNSVVVKHVGGYSTRYGHLSSIAVRNGQHVDAGDTIARSGNTGNSTGPHLHFELMKNGQRICPAAKVPGISKGSCVRQSI